MDVYCPKCGEPVDNDEFHDAAEAQSSSYKKVVAAFQRRGCEALGFPPCRAPHSLSQPGRVARATAASALYDILGDDMDGVAAMLEDCGI